MLAQAVEEALGEVAQRDQLGRAEEARAALDGVEATEDVVEQAGVVRAVLELDELVVDVGQQVAGFDEEVLQQILHPGKITHGLLLVAVPPHAGNAPVRAGPGPAP